MCGIAGIMTLSAEAPSRALMRRLQEALHHRGPDARGHFSDAGICLVSTRLAVIDVEHGQQPLYGPGGLVAVANGEIYNSPELRAGIGGGVFATQSDCEVALHLYASEGLGYVEALRGMYAIALYDPASRRLVLSRDPFGIKPLYYVSTEDMFAFASEPHVFLEAGLAKPGVTVERAAELLQLKFTVGRDTIFPGIHRVLPGETLVIERGRIVDRLRRAPLRTGVRRGGNTDLVSRLDDVLTDSVAVHLRADVPRCLFLSSGIDSAALLAAVRRLGASPDIALTIGYENGDPADESREAMRLASAVGTRCARVQMTSEDFWALAPSIAAAVDDPTTDPATLPTYVLGRAAAKAGIKVALSGEGGDELFGGYARYRRARLPLRWLSRRRRREGIIGPVGTTLGDWRRGLHEAEDEQRGGGRSAVQVMQALDCAESLPNALLLKLDRSLMAHGLEGRTPFLDPALAEFAFGLPDRHKVGIGRGKLLLRTWLALTLPEAAHGARKKSFMTPVGRWMQQRSPQLETLLAANPALRMLGLAEAAGAAAAHAAKRPQAAWSFLFYALWHSHHVLGLASGGTIDTVLRDAARY